VAASARNFDRLEASQSGCKGSSSSWSSPVASSCATTTTTRAGQAVHVILQQAIYARSGHQESQERKDAICVWPRDSRVGTGTIFATRGHDYSRCDQSKCTEEAEERTRKAIGRKSKPTVDVYGGRWHNGCTCTYSTIVSYAS
jgi:hypothetical protein